MGGQQSDLLVALPEVTPPFEGFNPSRGSLSVREICARGNA